MLEVCAVLGDGREGYVPIGLNEVCRSQRRANSVRKGLNLRDPGYADSHKNIVCVNDLREGMPSQVAADHAQRDSDGLSACRTNRGTSARNHSHRR